MFFTDEPQFTLSFNDGRIRVWRRPGECFHDATVREHDGYGDRSVIVWNGFWMHHRTPLHRTHGNLTDVGASPTARDFFLANFYIPGPTIFVFFSKISPEFFLCWLLLMQVLAWTRRIISVFLFIVTDNHAGSRVECPRNVTRLQNMPYCAL